jgi:Xaa-Pro aminopeptidase
MSAPLKADAKETMTPINRFRSIGFDRSRMCAAMKTAGVPAMLLTSPENVYYTTGYTALPSAGNPILYMLRNRLPFFSFVTDEGKVTLICWGFSTWDMEFGADEVIGFNNLDEGCEALQRLVVGRSMKGSRLGLESTCPLYVLGLIRATEREVELVDANALLDEVRLIKSPAEIECLRKSVEIIETTCAELFGLLYVGMGRNELTREAKYRLIRNGAEGVSHLTFSFAQANPEFDIDEKLEKGRLVTLDLGAIYRGYCSDNRRYAYSGKVPSELEDIYQQMVEIVDAVGAALAPGTRYYELMELARSLYAARKLTPLGRFNHVGHNIGLETEERWLDNDTHTAVRAGMVINIELYSTAATGEQIGDEETYIIEPTGPVRISRLPRQIREIP